MYCAGCKKGISLDVHLYKKEAFDDFPTIRLTFYYELPAMQLVPVWLVARQQGEVWPQILI
jgi:hypothetical protein